MGPDYAFRRAAIRYWERRRIIYNLALVPPSLFAYMLTAGVIYVGDPHQTHYYFLLFWFALSALGANICYSFAYALEFLCGSDDPTSRWLRFGRTTAFVGGVVFAMFLALIGGRNIAMMEFYGQFKHAGNIALRLQSTLSPESRLLGPSTAPSNS
jgi:hypothetical protein